MYVGPCPFCPDGGDDRLHVCMEASAGRPAEPYWCRVCNQSALLKHLDREESSSLKLLPSTSPTALRIVSIAA